MLAEKTRALQDIAGREQAVLMEGGREVQERSTRTYIPRHWNLDVNEHVTVNFDSSELRTERVQW